jgi:hypothetical protein
MCTYIQTHTHKCAISSHTPLTASYVPPGQEKYLCKNAVHRLPFSLQHHSALSVQLGPGPQVLKVGNNTSAMLILNTGAPQGVRAQPPPVLPVHSLLRDHARLQLNHQVC